MTDPSLAEALLRRDKAIVVAGLSGVIALSWLYLLAGAGMGMPAWRMTSLEAALGLGSQAMMAMAMPVQWTPGYAALVALMWWVMMIAMMLPSATPMILLYARVRRRKAARPDPAGAIACFLGGYGLAWGGFSLAAAGAQWGLERTGLLSTSMMNSESQLFSGALLIAAGLYQLTSLKQACLRHCRGPIDFLARHWRPGKAGALGMGLHHGVYCLGCCWGLMLLLFFGGVMNLYWIAGLALLVLIEKLGPAAGWFSRFLGIGLIAWGAAVLASGLA